MGLQSKDRKDVYYRMSKENKYRARSVYKLSQIDDTYNIFENIKNVVDLCGAPGSWSQYVAKKNLKIMTIDLQDIEPIEGVYIIKEDVTSQKCIDEILSYFKPTKVDLILCDGAPDITGIHDIDEYFQSKILCAALKIATETCELGGCFLGKMFRGKYSKYVVDLFKKFYREVIVVKPKSSRFASIECFIYCKYLHNFESKPEVNIENIHAEDFEVLGCNDGPDSDLITELIDKIALKPTSLPIKPPYEDSIKIRKGDIHKNC